MLDLIQRMLWRSRQNMCAHEFALDDLEKTNYPELDKPADNASYEEWLKYHTEIYTHESHTKRVKWPCAKCGKVFYGHCGLDIYKHGTPQRRPLTLTPR